MEHSDCKPLKVLFILPSLNSGGAERVLITLMNATDSRFFSPSLLTINNKGELGHLIDPSIPHDTLNKKSVLWSLPYLYYGIKRIHPDIVVSTMEHMNFAVLALKPFFPKTAFIARTAITPSFLLKKYKPLNFLIKMLYRGLYPKADLLLSPSQIIFDEFYYDLSMPMDNFALLRNPIDVPAMRQKILLPEIAENRTKTVHFVACGRLEKQKGFDRLIKALAQMDSQYDWRLTILGEGSERAPLEGRITEHALNHKIVLKGLIKEPYSYFAEADCFLLPSRAEGLPNVALESLACGTPVIAMKEAGGIEEIAKDAAEGAVRIAGSFTELIHLMQTIEPFPVTRARPSLLPYMYKKEHITHTFNDILDSASWQMRSFTAVQDKKETC